MFLGLMKYYRQSYMDLLAESDFDPDFLERCRLLVERFFDRVEIGFCTEWATAEEEERIHELQVSNRMMTNEKNKYLTIFESQSSPVILIDNKQCIENMNHAASLLFNQSGSPGAYYYYESQDRKEGMDNKENFEKTCFNLISAEALLPWLIDELKDFIEGASPFMRFEKEFSNGKGQQYFRVTLSRMLDVSGKFEGVVVILQDVTLEKKADMERAQKERLQGVLEMAGAICHELTQPLQSISGYAQILQLNLEENQNATTKIRKIKNQVDRMGEITRKLQGITKYETKDYLKGTKIIDIDRSSSSNYGEKR
jgi:PAS domain-containing protein